MAADAKIAQADLERLSIIRYPDPRLREVCTPVGEVDASVRALVERMFGLMFAGRGVGLAAPQVGVTCRLFIASPTFDQADRHVYINPQVLDADGVQEGEEGCLSFPDIYTGVKRHNRVIVRAQGLDGEWFEQAGEELHARIIEHESDHLEGMLLVDRMGTVARLSHRRALKELEQTYAAAKA